MAGVHWYDGSDADCGGDDDFDQDGDGVDWPADCDDLDPAVYPGAVDSPDDGWDQDCDGLDGGSSVDEDGDEVTWPVDCDDLDAAVYPGATEIWYDGADADCGGDSDFDQDGDHVDWPADCDDLDAAVFPGATETWYDGSDADCGGDSDFDQDGDHVDWPADCDDLDAAVFPGAPETCNTFDDDCDSLVDEAGSVGEVVWYTDADLDGYGDPSTGLRACTAPAGGTADQSDCDDQAAETYPGAPERCDGQQNDCAITAWTGAEEDGEVWLESSSGAWTSYTSAWAAGVLGAPASVALPASGTLWVCDGDYYVNLTASSSGSLALEGLYDSAVLSGGGVGSVVAVSGSGTTLSLGGLTLTDGVGSGSPAAGGALKVTAGTVTVTGCVLEGNHATNGGGLYVSGGTVTVTNSQLTDNTATSGGGWYQAGGTVTLTSDQVEANSATDGGGGYYASGTFSNSGLSLTDNVASSTGGGLRANTSATLTSASLVGNDAANGGGVYYGGSSGTLALATTLVDANTATAYGGGVYQAAGTLTCTGTSSGTYGFIANVATTGGGGVYLKVKTNVFTTTTCDFGTSTTTNNSAQDILYRTTAYNKGNDVTVSCRNGTCR